MYFSLPKTKTESGLLKIARAIDTMTENTATHTSDVEQIVFLYS
jgi:hypothetical protein